ncbi:isochorismate synthase [Corynebacterium mastitidis]
MPETPREETTDALRDPLTRGDLLFCQPDQSRYLPAAALTPVPPSAAENPWRPGMVVAGAVPFDEAGPTPPALWTAPAWRAWRRGAQEEPAEAARPRLRGVYPTRAPWEYVRAVRRAVERLSAPDGAVEKVVLAREIRATLGEEPDWAALMGRLADRNPSATVFSVPVPGEADPGAVFFGASPELLLRKSGDAVLSHPLAGSVPRSADPEEDRRRANALLESAKDAREHAFVTRMIGQALAPVCAELSVPTAPSLLATDTMWHLGTRIEGRLAPEHAHRDALSLARLLHPTPAVAGWPTRAAMSAIRRLEHADRGLYAGAVGWVDSNGDGQWNVSIRCALLRGLEMSAWGGAGIVAESVAESELKETSAKLRTIVEGLGVDAEEAEHARW